MSAERISVVICTYNRDGQLRRALDTVLQQETDGTFDYEVVVVDDGSTDATAQVVQHAAESDKAPVKYVHEGGRQGIAVARNRGVEAAQGNWIVFFDDDQLAQRGWLKNLLRVAQAHGASLVGGARTLDVPDADRRRLGPVCRGILGENIYSGAPTPLQGKELPTTGNLLLSRKVFDRVGLFDPSMVASGEDSDLIQRARQKGLMVWTAPDAVVAHMIPRYRLQPEYFRWVSHRWGNQFAEMDYKRGGPKRLAGLMLARAAQAVLLHVPRLCFAVLTMRRARMLDARALLWRASGYARKGLNLLFPRLFAQPRYFERLKFRNERELFAGGEEEAAPS